MCFAAVHPPAHVTSSDDSMDFFHPPMVHQDEESSFSTFLHPPMVLSEELQLQESRHQDQQQQQQQQHQELHPPMLPSDSIYSSQAGRSDFYDSAMHAC
jgi:7-keto-8-aminopelargonate synthetase-like enzyme